LTNENPDLSLGEATSRYLDTLEPQERSESQPDMNRFVRWFGSQRAIAGIAASEIENYAERLSLKDTEYTKKLEIVRAFLIAAKKSKWTKSNLSTNLKLKKTKTKQRVRATRQDLSEKVILTQQGYDEIQAELTRLESRKLELIGDIQRAAADKDFRENAPLHAAREEKGRVEGRMMELDTTLKAATIMDEVPNGHVHISIGNTVLLCDLGTGEEMRYMLVNPREVDLKRRRISCESPIGQALMGKSEGETADVIAPVGKIQYRIKQIE
jgi:transcription elongation factor GreA